MSMRSVISLRAVRTNLSAYAFALGLRGGILQTVTSASASTASKVSVNWPAWSRMRAFELVGPVTEVHEQISALLCGPGPVGVGSDAEDVYVAAGDLGDEEHVQALPGQRAVDVEEVAGEHGGRLGGKESTPGGVVAAHRRRVGYRAV
jgi:hypothetical protein